MFFPLLNNYFHHKSSANLWLLQIIMLITDSITKIHFVLLWFAQSNRCNLIARSLLYVHVFSVLVLVYESFCNTVYIYGHSNKANCGFCCCCRVPSRCPSQPSSWSKEATTDISVLLSYEILRDEVYYLKSNLSSAKNVQNHVGDFIRVKSYQCNLEQKQIDHVPEEYLV